MRLALGDMPLFAFFAGGGCSGDGLVAARGRSLALPRLALTWGLAVRCFASFCRLQGGVLGTSGNGLAALLALALAVRTAIFALFVLVAVGGEVFVEGL